MNFEHFFQFLFAILIFNHNHYNQKNKYIWWVIEELILLKDEKYIGKNKNDLKIMEIVSFMINININKNKINLNFNFLRYKFLFPDNNSKPL